MKINFRQPFKDFRGNEVKANGNPVLIADEVGKVLFNMSMKGDVPLNTDEKYMAYKLCNRICQSNEVELTAEECSFVIVACGRTLTAGAYGQVRDLIENIK